MKKEFSIKVARKEFKSVTGTISHCISVIYSEYDKLEGTTLHKVLPKTKKEAMEFASSIYTWGKVGEERIIKRTIQATGCTTEIHTTVKPSVDMVLRYFVAKANGDLNK